MPDHTIDTAMAKRMAQASAIHGAAIIGQPGGWSVILRLGLTEKPLGTQRTDKPRLWRSLDRCIDYLKTELDIARVDLVDASQHSAAPVAGRGRQDTAERMRRTHQAAAYDKWFREQVHASLEDPRPAVPHEQVKQHFAAKREALHKRVKSRVKSGARARRT